MNSGERSVINEIRQRPFVRPLIFWITGTILQLCFPLRHISILLFAGAAVWVVLSFFVSGEPSGYPNRRVWGVIFACTVIFLSIQRMSLAEQQAGRTAEQSLLLKKAGEVQARMLDKLDALHLTDESKATLATLTLNYRRNMPRTVISRFAVAGVSHLLAVSGFHVGIITAFIGLILSVMPARIAFFRSLKYLLTILGVWIFTYTTGLATAAVRAAVMISIYLAGRMIGREPDKYNTVAAAAFCMLVYNPLYLFDIGFQLSYTAVFFILYLQPRLSGLLKVRNPLLALPWNILTVSVAAQAGVLGLCFYYFGQSSSVFLFTNLILSLLATILIPATLLWMTLPPSIPGIGILRSAIEAMTDFMMWAVDRFSSIPGASVSVRFDFLALIFSYLCIAMMMLYFRTRNPRMLIAFLAATLAFLCLRLYHHL